MKFIELEENNIQEGVNLAWKVFEEFQGEDYSKEGIKNFKSFIECNYIIKKFRNGEFKLYGCINNDKLIGIITTKNINHICMLFVDKEYHKKGIGKNLFKIVEDICKARKNITKITVNSSPYAVGFYKKIGFTVKDNMQNINGIKFIAMEYLINNISFKLSTYLEAKERTCNVFLEENYEKNLNQTKKIIEITKKVKEFLKIYIINNNDLNEEDLLDLMDFLIIISKDNINHLVKCSSIIRNQNFSNISFLDHTPACVNLTMDFKYMNECILAFSKELQEKYTNINFREKIEVLKEIAI